MTVAYDAGVLLAAAADDRRTWVDHRNRLASGRLPVTSAGVVAQVSRSAGQVQLRRFLHLVHVAAAEGIRTILTSDPGDISRLVDGSGVSGIAVRAV